MTVAEIAKTGEEVRLFFAWASFMNQSNSLFAYEQLQKLDFWCSVDLWHTPMVDGIADIALPAVHWLEMDCLRKSQGCAGGLGATVKCIDAPGEAKPDQEILMRIAKEAGVPYYPGATPDEMWPVDNALYAANTFVLSMGFRIKDWNEYKAEFQKNGWFDLKVENPSHWGTYRRYETGNVDYDATNPGWRTTTQKQEIWSTVLETWVGNGEQFPKFEEAPHSPVADPDRYKDDNAFLMTTGRRQGTYFHSEHRQLPWCRELWPVPRLEINPDDAARLGIEQGDWVWIETQWDDGQVRKIREVADLYYGIQPGVVNAEHQWWYPELSQADRGFKLSGVNCLIDRHAQDRNIGSSNLRAYAVRVCKATAENSPFGNPVPCGDDGTEVIHASDDPRLKDWMPVYEGEGVTHDALCDSDRPEQVRRLPGVQRVVQGCEQRAGWQLLEQGAAHRPEPAYGRRPVARRVHVLSDGAVPALQNPRVREGVPNRSQPCGGRRHRAN